MKSTGGPGFTTSRQGLLPPRRREPTPVTDSGLTGRPGVASDPVSNPSDVGGRTQSSPVWDRRRTRVCPPSSESKTGRHTGTPFWGGWTLDVVLVSSHRGYCSNRVTSPPGPVPSSRDPGSLLVPGRTETEGAQRSAGTLANGLGLTGGDPGEWVVVRRRGLGTAEGGPLQRSSVGRVKQPDRRRTGPARGGTSRTGPARSDVPFGDPDALGAGTGGEGTPEPRPRRRSGRGP